MNSNNNLNSSNNNAPIISEADQAAEADLRAKEDRIIAERRAKEEEALLEAMRLEDVEDEAVVASAAVPTDDEIKQEMLDLFAGASRSAAEKSRCTAFLVTTICMKAGQEHRSSELLAAAFDSFPQKEHCLLMLPHGAVEAPVMQEMIHLPSVPGSLQPNVLFLLSKDSLTKDFSVELGSIKQLAAVEALVRGLPNAADILDSFMNAVCAPSSSGTSAGEEGRGGGRKAKPTTPEMLSTANQSNQGGAAILALSKGEVVGVLTVNLSVDTELLMANFRLSQHFDLDFLTLDAHGEIDMICLNPIFENRFRIFLTAAQRLLRKKVLYYALPPSQPPPPLLEVMTQAAPRHRIAADRFQAEFALYLFTRRSAFRRRVMVNNHVVVVGASECGLAVLESLLLDDQLQFNHLTLLAPGGIKVGGVACQYSAAIVAKMGLDARVTLLDAEMVGLNRERCLLDLSDDSQIAYDILLVAAGVQDQSRYALVDACPEIAGILVTDLELAANFTKEDALTMNNILVYGNSLQSYNALYVLESRGATNKISFVASPGEDDVFVRILKDAADIVGIELPEPSRESVTNIVPSSESSPIGIVAAVTLLSAAVRGEGEEERGGGTGEGGDGKGGGPPPPPPLNDNTANTTTNNNNNTNNSPNSPLSPPPPPTSSSFREIAADLIVGCAPPSVGRHLFECLNDSSLVFDERLVVDARFRTNDPSIFAAGSIAKFSRRYGGTGLPMQNFNSREVGIQTAASIVQSLLANSSTTPSNIVTGIQEQSERHDLLLSKKQYAAALRQMVSLSIGKVVGCTVTGGHVFLFAGKAEAMAAPSLTPPPDGGRCLRTVTSKGGFFQIVLDSKREVHAIVYLGRSALTPMRLGTLIGLHESYLNRIQERYDAGEIEDLLGFITEPWAEILYHDQFPDLRKELVAAAVLQVAGLDDEEERRKKNSKLNKNNNSNNNGKKSTTKMTAAAAAAAATAG
eukprot:CAMPEP_0175050738 /NCGR_PEP_ID=MMETSP0052_2-20121109/7419_1 /TAXON_ID=51329 ORGANISM="Polytomella parva, Strain SAG 63-3" /NCGR_SAMPLE_ID=MMETSP0052_2 /ASSEMBLY_ACC=CAM_ASM_000194 /LENGTH=970 /DNA_ID=CAMNT_0016314961 /DNA_START=32 /DNA_END=2941 /DNA_ORIENTATION=+